MSNIKKYYIFNSLYFIGFMFCSGALMQTFLLQVGFSEKQVYTLNSFIQMIQVIMMVVMTFLSDKIRKVKLVTGLSYLSLTVVCFIFLLGAINPSILGKSYVIAVFIGAGISYLGLGLYMILSYCLPYYIIDMKEYGRVSSLAAAISGLCTFALSFLHTFFVAKFDYMQAMAWFFVLAIVCLVITAWMCISMKETQTQPTPGKTTKEELVAVFKNKNTYLLLLPNFVRGLATGIVGVITVIAITSNVLDEENSSIVNIITQVTMLLGNLVYALFCKKVSSKQFLLVSTFGMCLLLPGCLMFGVVGFSVLLFLILFFRNIIDAAIPVLVTEIIPKNQIGAYTSIRMLVYTAAQAVATLIISPIVGVVGYVGLLIFAAVMQLICGLVYYIVAKTNKTQVEIV